jgi:hypothetical protein
MTFLAHTVSTGAKPFTLYGLTDNINHFLSTDLTPDEEDGPENITVSRPGGTRQQYPGDTTPVAYGSSTAVVLRDPSAKDGGSALPGRPVIFQSVTGLNENGSPIYDETRQFHLRGNIVNLNAYLRTNAAGPMRLISSRGRRYKIKFDEIDES